MNSSVISELYSNGDTPLHLAVPWPNGLKLLLGHGNGVARSKLEHVNDRGDTALSLAISLREVDSIRLLVNSGAKLGRTYFEHLGEMRFFSQGYNSDTITKRIICILVRVFAQRRKELLSFALRYLPMNHITSLQLQDKKILDHEAQWF